MALNYIMQFWGLFFLVVELNVLYSATVFELENYHM